MIVWQTQPESRFVDIRCDEAHADVLVEALKRMDVNLEIMRMLRDLQESPDAAQLRI